MKTKKQLKEKIRQLQEYLDKGIAITELYSLDKTKSFIGGLNWALDEPRKDGD